MYSAIDRDNVTCALHYQRREYIQKQRSHHHGRILCLATMCLRKPWEDDPLNSVPIENQAFSKSSGSKYLSIKWA